MERIKALTSGGPAITCATLAIGLNLSASISLPIKFWDVFYWHGCCDHLPFTLTPDVMNLPLELSPEIKCCNFTGQ
jgi:hypothetical protein